MSPAFVFSPFLSFAIVLSEELMLSDESLGALMALEESVVLGELMVPVVAAGADAEFELLGSAANAVPPSSAASAKAGITIFSACI